MRVVENHYFFCGRDIVAYKAFNVPIETAWNTLNESQRALSGIENHARLSITHYKGKTEVNAVTNEPIPGTRREARTAWSSSSFCAMRSVRRIEARSASSDAIPMPSGSMTMRTASSSMRRDSSTTSVCTDRRGKPAYPRESMPQDTVADDRQTGAKPAEAVADIADGSSIMVGGFGEAGSPIELIHALIDQGASDLTVISNNTGSGEVGLAALLKERRVTKVICSFPKTLNSTVFPELYREGFTELELVPQGTLAERIRAGGAGFPRSTPRPRWGPHWPKARKLASSMGVNTCSNTA